MERQFNFKGMGPVSDIDKERNKISPLVKHISNPIPSRLQGRLLKDCLETKMYYDVSYVRKAYDTAKQILYTLAGGPLYFETLGFSLPSI